MKKSLIKNNSIVKIIVVSLCLISCQSNPSKEVASETNNYVPEKNDMLQAADISVGQTISLRCGACHSLSKADEPGKIGPNLFGIVGAKHARRADYAYSNALKQLKDRTWTVDNLYKWLRDPEAYAPGTLMPYAGLMDPQDRLDLIAYLMTLK